MCIMLAILACPQTTNKQKKTWKLWSLLRLQRSIQVLRFFICLNQTTRFTFSQCRSPCFTYILLESITKTCHSQCIWWQVQHTKHVRRVATMCNTFKWHRPTSCRNCDIWPSSLFFSASKNQKTQKKSSNHFNHISYHHFKEEITLCIENKIQSKAFHKSSAVPPCPPSPVAISPPPLLSCSYSSTQLEPRRDCSISANRAASRNFSLAKSTRLLWKKDFLQFQEIRFNKIKHIQRTKT